MCIAGYCVKFSFKGVDFSTGVCLNHNFEMLPNFRVSFNWLNHASIHTVNANVHVFICTTFQNQVYTDQTSIEMKRDVLWKDFTWLLRRIDTEGCSGSVLEMVHSPSQNACSVNRSYNSRESTQPGMHLQEHICENR